MSNETKIDDGGPAFARPAGPGAYSTDQRGMSLRDWFAGQALGSSLANPYLSQYGDLRTTPMARAAYEYADAMLAARQKREG